MVHPTAVVAESALIGEGVSLGANCVIGERVVIGDGSSIGANTVVEEGACLGKDCYLRSNVTLYHQVKLGERVAIHSGAVIGSDGFGFARHVRTTTNNQGGQWSGDAVYTISAALPRGLKTIDAEVIVADCEENGIPTV